MNKIIKIDQKNTNIIVCAENVNIAEMLVLKTDIFNSNIEIEIDEITIEKNGNFRFHYTEYGDADWDAYL